MNRVRSACVKTVSLKTCFVSLSGDLAEVIGLRIQGQPFALQLQWSNGRAFTSWSGEVIRNRKEDSLTGTSSVIQLGRKFADSLGLQEGQQVLVEPVTSITSCNKICMDPVSANDWEILELHAGYIENQLLNQVRVVFPGQLLPIWIQKNMCVVVKVVSLEPDVSCVRLDEFTEVIVSPKTRNFTSPKLDQQSSISSEKNATQASHAPSGTSQSAQRHQTENLAPCSNAIGCDSQLSSPKPSAMPCEDGASEAGGINGGVEKGFISRLADYFGSLLDTSDDQSHTSERHLTSLLPSSSGSTTDEVVKETICTLNNELDTKMFDETDIDLCLRVQPELNIKCFKHDGPCETESLEDSLIKYYSQQPSTVLVNFSSLPPSTLMSCSSCFSVFPPPDGTVVRTVQIKKLVSPKERAAANVVNTASRREGVDGSDLPRRSDHGNSSQPTPSDNESNKDVPPHWIVRMVMTGTRSSDLVNQRSHEMDMEQSVLQGHVAVSQELRILLGAEDLSLVKLQSVSHDPSEIQGIILHPFGDTVEKLRDISSDTAVGAFHEWLYSVCNKEFPLLLCSGMVVTVNIPQGHCMQFSVTILSHQQTSNVTDMLPYYHVTPETVERVTVVMGAPAKSPQGADQTVNSQDSPAQSPKHTIEDLGGVKEAFGKCLDHTLSALGQRPLVRHLGGDITTGVRSGALLICGSGSGAGIGCGKTSLARAVCHKLQQWPVYAHVTVVDCIPFRGKRVDVIQKNWQQIFVEAAWHQPAVILFDDLDQVISAPSALQELGGEALYKRRLAKVFKDLITTEIINNSKVIVVATSRSHDSLHPSLLTSRGCHVFQCCAELHPPDANQREQILSAMIKKKLLGETEEGMELGSLIKKTEGFSPKDLRSLLERASHMAAIRKMKVSQDDVSPVLTMEDFKEALEGFTPAALRGVSLHTAGELGWSDVGGLVEIKAALVETLLWPTKYSWLFSKCPLRMRSGLLLYGPPGTGKTLLAGVVAKECGLNFISIKGPELLSKYIGASEQAVRDMFTRAQSAKPCILFFDEFDSLAPRRGHDNTGVTDRVVNQLLTQLDGVEGLDGVYVLAATSRPDLIDPALLRPGRLDKCLYCGIPEKSERLKILQALSRSLLLAEDADLEAISNMCGSFTGADFKALLYNAQLAAIHRNTSNSQLFKGKFGDDKKASQESNNKEHAGKSLIYIPSLVEGRKDLSVEELTKLQSEVVVIQENLNQSMTDQKFFRSDSSGAQVTCGIQIDQSDLLQAASSMGPSVSDSERTRYQAIYDTFIKSRGGEFSHNMPGQGKATLA